MWWPYALFMATQGNDKLADELILDRKCSVGSEMFPIGEIFIGFTIPGSDKICGDVCISDGIWNYAKVLPGTLLIIVVKKSSRSDEN